MIGLPDIRQKTDCDCGPSCVRAICRLWGDSPPKDLGYELLQTDDGTDLTAVESWLRRRGYCVLSGSMTVADLRQQTSAGRPVLTPITDHGEGHYVVVLGVGRGVVTFHDPSAGRRKMRVAEWEPIWFGVAKSVRYDRWGVAIWRE